LPVISFSTKLAKRKDINAMKNVNVLYLIWMIKKLVKYDGMR
jgi:hypothetical protein